MMQNKQLLPANIMARRLRVNVRWLRAEAEAGRIPHVKAEKQFLFDADAVQRVLLDRAGTENVKTAEGDSDE